MNQIINLIKKLLGLMQEEIVPDQNNVSPAPIPSTYPEAVPTTTFTPPVPAFYWNTPEAAQHSVRVICDQEGLTFNMSMGQYSMKIILLACVQIESGFNTNAIHYNHDGQGNISSTDFGIAQINDFWNIGTGKPFPSSDYVLQNPEACIRFMCKQFLAGNAKLWCSFSSGAYLKVVNLFK